jgi:hypothetical protein
VEIGGTSIGTFTTDSSGAGSLTLSDLTTPPISKGSVLTVVDSSTPPNTVLTGTFATGGECHHDGALIANLTGATGTSGTAEFKAGEESGENRFELSVSGLTANTTYTVEVGGSSIGTFTTDSTGAGSLELKDITTTIAAGSVLTVVDANNNTVLTGTFAVAAEGGDDHHHGGQELTASLTGTTGASGTADFKSSSTPGQNSFSLTVTGLTASTTYTVQVGGTSIGMFTTDSKGAGSLTLTNLTTTITKGSVLTVLDGSTPPNTVLTGTFTTASKGDEDDDDGDDHQGGQELNAKLTGAMGATGSAEFTAGSATGQNAFTLLANGLTANTKYTVDVGSTSIGTFTTDANGAGALALTDLTTTISDGTVLTVVDANGNTVLTGTFASGHGEGGGDDNNDEKSLSAALTGATGTSGMAQFKAGDSAGENHFELSASGLTASTTYTVQIGGTSIGTFTTDANGAGSLELKNLTTTISAGTALTVVDANGNTVLSGTFAAGGGDNQGGDGGGDQQGQDGGAGWGSFGFRFGRSAVGVF